MTAEQALAAEQNAYSEPRELRLSFVGSGSEYFRIWIVNLFLSILTLGIYSAWAKVRREQYFHRNTLLDGSGFDYHGNPKAILKGRVIAVGLVAILFLIGVWKPGYDYLMLLLYSPLIPWLLVRSFIFRARNTSFRGLRFNFLGTYKGACRAFVGYFLLFIALNGTISYSLVQLDNPYQVMTEQTMETDEPEADKAKDIYDEADDDVVDSEGEAEELEEDDNETEADETNVHAERSGWFDVLSVYAVAGFHAGSDWYWVLIAEFAFVGILLLLPAFMCDFKRFQMGHCAFGTLGFRTQLRVLPFYGIYLRAFWPFLVCLGLLMALAVVAGFIGVFLTLNLVALWLYYGGGYPGGYYADVLVCLVWFLGIFFLMRLPYLNALIGHQVWNNTRLEGHRFVSDQKPWDIAIIALLNGFLTLLTCGLYWPWAKVRMAAYRARHAAIRVAGNLDD
jgi:uncharacterized membrane protein YjgN (DUF898 family)